MDWLNPPPHFRDDAGVVTVTTAHDTDFWRKTVHDFIADNGHFYYETISGDFEAVVKVSGAYNTLYDQAGLMLRQDENTWIKCGIEYVEGIQLASAVITRDVSDWSVSPLKDSPPSMWFKLKRIGAAVEVYFSHDGSDYTLLRQGYLTNTPQLQLGLMCCSPKGQGFTVTFASYAVTTT